MNQSQAAVVRGLRGRGNQGWYIARSAILAFTTLLVYGTLWLMPEAVALLLLLGMMIVRRKAPQT